jgi:phosphate transport system substrate-binding protein
MLKRFSVLMIVLVSGSLLISACVSAAPGVPTAASVASTDAPVVATVPPSPAELPAGSVTINGAGATFPLPVYTEWTYAYQYVDPSVVINYQGIGSGGGKKGIIDNTLDFAGSDSLLTDAEYSSGKDLQMYPMLAGAVVPIYNVVWNKAFPATGFTEPKLILDRQTLVDIYNAKITKWNDASIKALNPVLADYLPDARITVVHRSDGSGTTEIFTKALTSFSTTWTAGGASAIEWPVDKAGNGIGGKGNQGVAAAVINTPNSIGYVELSYALSNGMKFFDLINKTGNKVTANSESVASAMADFSGGFSDKLTATIVDGAGAKSFPIVGYTYIILHTTSMKDCVKAEKLLGFLDWALTDAGAAKAASTLGYSVLPAAVRDQVVAKYAQVTCYGKPVVK